MSFERTAAYLASRRAGAAPPFSWRTTILSIWESEGVLSIRLIIATGIAAFALTMRARGVQYMSTEECIKYLDVVKDLMLIGAAKVALSRFSPKPTVDSTQQPKPEETS